MRLDASRAGRRAVAIVRYTGLPGLWFAVLGELCYRRLAIREIMLDQKFPEPSAAIPVSFGLIDASQVDEYTAFRVGADPGSIGRRFERGDKCFVARDNGRIVSARWSATGSAQCDYLSRVVPLADDEVYIYDAFTLPEYRGRKIFPALTSEMHRYYKKEGKRRSLCFTAPENLPAMLADTGYRRIGMIGYVGLGPLRRPFTRVYAGERGPGD